MASVPSRVDLKNHWVDFSGALAWDLGPGALLLEVLMPTSAWVSSRAALGHFNAFRRQFKSVCVTQGGRVLSQSPREVSIYWAPRQGVECSTLCNESVGTQPT